MTRALTSAEKAAAALTWCSALAPGPAIRSCDTDRATNSSPISAPATLAHPLKKS
jgi:hypothetical protein